MSDGRSKTIRQGLPYVITGYKDAQPIITENMKSVSFAMSAHDFIHMLKILDTHNNVRKYQYKWRRAVTAAVKGHEPGEYKPREPIKIVVTQRTDGI